MVLAARKVIDVRGSSPEKEEKPISAQSQSLTKAEPKSPALSSAQSSSIHKHASELKLSWNNATRYSCGVLKAAHRILMVSGRSLLPITIMPKAERLRQRIARSIETEKCPILNSPLFSGSSKKHRCSLNAANSCFEFQASQPASALTDRSKDPTQARQY